MKLMYVKIKHNVNSVKLSPPVHDDDVTTNPTWRTAAILKIVTSPYLSRESSEFDEIWFADANFETTFETTCKTSCAVTSLLFTRGLSFQPTSSNFTRRHVFKFH